MKDDTGGEQPLSRSGHKVAIVGVGHAGLNTITRLFRKSLTGYQTVVVSDDDFHLSISRADHKIHFNHGADSDRECHSFPSEDSGSSLDAMIGSVLPGVETVLVACGLGGSAGAKLAPRILSIARDTGIDTVAFCIWPFTNEGECKRRVAEMSLDAIKEHADRLVIFHNDSLLEIEPMPSISEAFAIVDESVISNLSGIRMTIG